MGWLNPWTFIAGQKLTAAQMNAYLRDNTNFLHKNVRFFINTAASNSGTGETDLTGYTYPISANELASVGDGYDIDGQGSCASNAATKTIRLDVAGQKYVLLQTTANGGYWTFKLRLSYYSNTQLRYSGYSTYGAAGGGVPTLVHHFGAMSSLNFTTAQTLKLTAQGSIGSADITAQEFMSRWIFAT